MIFKAHFYYLTNKEETVINEFNKNIPKFLKFIQAEAEKERKDKDLQLRLMTIMKKNNKTNALITIVLFVMAIMKENADLMFITFEVNINVHQHLIICYFYKFIEILTILFNSIIIGHQYS